MEHEQLFIAPMIKVGFQKRDDTYTKNLAYVIYYDLTGKLRKEKSWENWRDKKIDPVDFRNDPTEGFVLNKKVGGGRSHWDARQEYVRVYDPRGFEFEITVPNLLFILRECDCSRGKGLEGKFVYAWSGTTLVLLPVVSEEYKKSYSYTNLQNKKIPAKELVKGAAYLTVRQDKWIYLDRRLRHNANLTDWRSKGPVEFVYVFWDEGTKDFIFQKDVKRLAAVISDSPASNYAELIEKYDKSIHGSPPVRLFTKKQPGRKHKPDSYWYSYYWATEVSEGIFHQCTTEYIADDCVPRLTKAYEVSLRDVATPIGKGTKFVDYVHKQTTSNLRYQRPNDVPVVEPTSLGLWVELSSGSKFKMRGSEYPSWIEEGDTDGED